MMEATQRTEALLKEREADLALVQGEFDKKQHEVGGCLPLPSLQVLEVPHVLVEAGRLASQAGDAFCPRSSQSLCTALQA